MDDLLREFLTETNESLDTVDVELVRFEQEPNNTSILGNIFRLVHTIKGTCGFLGLPRLEALAHAAETLMGKFRDGMPVTGEAVTLILSTIDRLKEVLTGLEQTEAEPEGNDKDLIGELERMAMAAAKDERAARYRYARSRWARGAAPAARKEARSRRHHVVDADAPERGSEPQGACARRGRLHSKACHQSRGHDLGDVPARADRKGPSARLSQEARCRKRARPGPGPGARAARQDRPGRHACHRGPGTFIRFHVAPIRAHAAPAFS